MGWYFISSPRRLDWIGREVDHTPASSAELRTRGASPPLLQYIFMSCYLITGTSLHLSFITRWRFGCSITFLKYSFRWWLWLGLRSWSSYFVTWHDMTWQHIMPFGLKDFCVRLYPMSDRGRIVYSGIKESGNRMAYRKQNNME